MNELNPTSVKLAGEIMAPELGLSWEKDREEVVKHINLFRNLLYNKFANFSLFDSVFHCLRIEQFKNECISKCSCEDKFYYGATLPPNVAGVMGAWIDAESLPLHSRWDEVMNGIGDKLHGEISTQHLDSTFPTQIEMVGCDTLKVSSSSPKDDGKIVFVSVRKNDGSSQKIEFKIIADEWAHTHIETNVIEHVILPSNLTGLVTLAQGEGRVLSVYKPTERVPSYGRLKILNLGCGCPTQKSLWIKSTRKYQDVYFDTDIVEVGDRIILDIAGTYFRYWKSKDGNERNIADRALADLYMNLDGIMKRYRGRQLQDGMKYSPKINHRSNLYRRHEGFKNNQHFKY